MYIGLKSRTERPRKTKIGTEVAHITRDSDTTFKVKRSKVNLQGRGNIVAASRRACIFCSIPFSLVVYTFRPVQSGLVLVELLVSSESFAYSGICRYCTGAACSELRVSR